MQRVKTATAVTNKPPYSEAGVPAFFTSGDAVAGIPATAPGQDFFNMVQEELLNLIKAAGLTPSAVDDTQLRQAVLKLLAAHNMDEQSHPDLRELIASISIPTATVDRAGILKLAGTARALLGTDSATAISPADLAAVLAARPIIDLVARDQIALTNLRQIVNTAVTTGALVQGRMWELLTSEWATGSTGFAFMTGSPGYYTNLLQSVVGNPLANGTTMGAGQVCCIDLNCVLPAGKLMSAQVYAASPQAGFKVEVWRQVSGNQYSFVGQSQVVSLTAGLNTIVFTTPIDVQAGDRLGTYNPTQDVVFYSTTAGSRLWVNADPTTTTTFNAGSGTVAIQGTVLAGTGDMVLVQPAAIPLATAPAYADAFFLYKDDSGSAVLGADLVIEMSRDNGGTWTPAQGYTNETGTGGFDGTYAAIKARCNLSGQPSGTSLRARFATHNAKAQRVAAPAVYAE